MTPTTLLVISFLVCKNPASLCFDLCRNRLHRVSDHWPHVVIPLFFISYRTNFSFSAKALGEPPPLSGRFCFSASPPFQWHTHLCRPIPYAYAKDAKAYMIDVAGAVSEIAISSIADDTNNSVWFQLDDDGMIETLYVEIVDAPTSVDGETTANATATLTSNRGTITLKVKNTSSTTATTAWSAQMQIKNTQTGLVTYVDMGSGAALAANADNSEKTITGNSINLYQALVTINGVTIASNQIAG